MLMKMFRSPEASTQQTWWYPAIPTNSPLDLQRATSSFSNHLKSHSPSPFAVTAAQTLAKAAIMRHLPLSILFQLDLSTEERAWRLESQVRSFGRLWELSGSRMLKVLCSSRALLEVMVRVRPNYEKGVACHIHYRRRWYIVEFTFLDSRLLRTITLMLFLHTKRDKENSWASRCVSTEVLLWQSHFSRSDFSTEWNYWM